MIKLIKMIPEMYMFVIRKGKKVKKLVPRTGYKVINGKYVKMSSQEKIKRARSAIKASKKRAVQMNKINKKRKKSMKKRKSMGLN